MFADIKIGRISGILRTGITGLGFCRPGPRVFLCQRRNREKGDQHEQAEK